MRTWISTKYGEHPWLTIAVCVYLAISGVEITRNLLLADPLDGDDVGFSRWEEVPAPDGSNDKILLRWSEPRSTLYRPVEGTVLGLTVYRPEEAEDLIDVSFSLDGEPLDAYAVGGGTYSFRYYLPAVLAPGKWSDVQTSWAEDARAEAKRAEGGWFANWKELKPWSPPPAPPSIELQVTLTMAAASPSDPGTSATPVVGIATVEWLDEMPRIGAGFHGKATDASGVAFRWTRRWASQPLQVGGAEAVLRIRAIHPGIEDRPVDVGFFWGGELRETVSLSDTEWAEVAVDLGAETGSEGVLSIQVDRTWNPARAGVSEDRRELGVALGDITWR